jgi:hypothetical protein
MNLSRSAVRLTLACTLAWSGLGAAAARAQQEEADATRLDVERLPPEVIPVTRDMFHVGFYLHSDLGGQGFAGGAGRISRPGPRARVGFGYEFLPWLSLGSQLACSFHSTSAQAPPAPTAFQFYSLTVQAKAQLLLGVRAALWLAADGGIGWASGDFLQAWGLRDAGDIGPMYGGQLGFDYHLMNAHHSLGLLAGTHRVPNLDAFGDKALAVYGAAYLKYVF